MEEHSRPPPFINHYDMSHSPFIEVPQTAYIAQTAFQPQQPVVFSTNGCLGVSIADAFYGRLDGLDHRNEPHGIQSGMRVALRIMVSV